MHFFRVELEEKRLNQLIHAAKLTVLVEVVVVVVVVTLLPQVAAEVNYNVRIRELKIFRNYGNESIKPT
jgi:hypothetical protein